MKSLLAGSALAMALLFSPSARSEVSLSIDIAPPPLPVYAQPPVPGDGYIWTPGYWAWSAADSDYYWVPGTWVLAPTEGDLWTPGYWAFEGARYAWHIGYWGAQVGYYGGVNYGYGYTGTGYQGGRWDHGAFRYNRAASNVDRRFAGNAYTSAVVGGSRGTHVSFNGGKGGAAARPTASQRQFQNAQHVGPSAEQVAHEHTAVTTPTQRATGPHGQPQVAATPRPSAFSAPGVEHIRPQPAARPVPSGQRRQPAPRAEQPHAAQPRAEQPRAEQPRGEEPRKER